MLPEGTLEEQNDKKELEYFVAVLQDAFAVIIEEAVDMKQRQLKAKNKGDKKDEENTLNCVYGYYRVLELIRQHIEATSIPLSIFCLDKFDIDQLLK